MSNYALEGPKWTSNVITWSFGNTGDGPEFTGTIDAADQAVVRAAVARWASVANLTFREVSDSTPGVDVRIGWSKFGTTGSQIGEAAYSYTQQGSAETFVPGTFVELEDPSERALTGDPSNPIWQGTTTSLYQVALHEFGHALGLDHSTDPTAVMYASSGAMNRDLNQSDIDGIHAIYGTPAPAPSPTNVASVNTATSNQNTGAAAPVTPTPTAAPTAPLTPATTGQTVYRFFNAGDGTHFFTNSDAEKASLMASRADMKYEGVGLHSVNEATDPNAVPVYRFFDKIHGTHFYTASGTEKDTVAATRSDLQLEGIGFYQHAIQQAGDVAVTRFLDTSTNTYFYTTSPGEQSAVAASRPDLHLEGIAFYAPAS